MRQAPPVNAGVTCFGDDGPHPLPLSHWRERGVRRAPPGNAGVTCFGDDGPHTLTLSYRRERGVRCPPPLRHCTDVAPLARRSGRGVGGEGTETHSLRPRHLAMHFRPPIGAADVSSRAQSRRRGNAAAVRQESPNPSSHRRLPSTQRRFRAEIGAARPHSVRSAPQCDRTHSTSTDRSPTLAMRPSRRSP